MDNIDCVVIGHNTGHFDEELEGKRSMAEWFGAYRDAQVNSLLVDGKRITYMDFFNRIRRRADPAAEAVSAFDPMGLAGLHLTSFLDAHGLTAALVGEFQKGREELAELLASEPRAVAITTTFYFDLAPMQEIVQFIRERSPVTEIIIGGPYPSQLQRTKPKQLEFTLKLIGADIFVLDGQGELTLARVVRALKRGDDLTEIANLCLVERDRCIRTARKVEDNPINANRVNWSLFDRAKLQPFVMTRTAISCLFSCSFCTYPIRAGAHRLADIEVIEKELRQLDELGVRFVYFIDDTFNVPLPRFKKLCRMMIRNRFKFRWISYLRCGNMDQEGVRLATESGCVGALLGIESGDADVLKMMNKFANPDTYRKGIRWLEDAGIMAWALFFVGFPGETAASLRNTISLLQDTEPSFFATQIWFYDPSTPISARAKELKLRGTGYGWKHETMSWQEACDGVETMLREVNRSIYIPQTGFSFETIFYLMGRGVDFELIRSFLRTGQRMLVDGIGDKRVESASYYAELDRLVASHGSPRFSACPAPAPILPKA